VSDCKICFHKGDGKIMQRPVGGECERCNPRPISPIEDACVCPPLGEPRVKWGNHK
jgi:hypothetical protein